MDAPIIDSWPRSSSEEVDFYGKGIENKRKDQSFYSKFKEFFKEIFSSISSLFSSFAAKCSSLINRVSKQQPKQQQPLEAQKLSPDVKQTHDQMLAEIINSEEFKANPELHLIQLMVERGIIGCSVGDSARAEALTKAPDLFAKLNEYKFWIECGKHLYKDYENREEILAVLWDSIHGKEFHEAWETVCKACDDCKDNFKQTGKLYVEPLEFQLRLLVDVFNQAEALKEYKKETFIAE